MSRISEQAAAVAAKYGAKHSSTELADALARAGHTLHWEHAADLARRADGVVVGSALIDQIARETNQDPVAYRLRLFGEQHPRHRAALQLAVDQSGYGKKTLASGRAWGVAVHESFESVVAYVVEASVKDGQPVLHRVSAGVHCN